MAVLGAQSTSIATFLEEIKKLDHYAAQFRQLNARLHHVEHTVAFLLAREQS